LLRNSPEQYSELAKVGDVDSSGVLNAARKLIASLYDLKKKFVSCHENLNKLSVKLATCKEQVWFDYLQVNHPFFADQDMVVFQYCKTTTSVSL
jgi:hypothetical protein